MRFQNLVTYTAKTKDGRTAKVAVETALAEVNRLLMPKSPMIAYVAQKSDWRFDIESGIKAAFTLVQVPSNTVPVEIIFPKNRGTAMTMNWSGSAIQINGYWIVNASHSAIVGGVIHEWCHALGFHHQEKGMLGYIRRNYWNKNKSLYSLPYHLSDNIKKWVAEEPTYLTQGLRA